MAKKRTNVSLLPEIIEELERRIETDGGSLSSQIETAVRATQKASPAEMAAEIATEPARRLLQNGDLSAFTESTQRIIEGKK